MHTVNGYVYVQDKNIQRPLIGNDIKKAREHFAASTDEFWVSPNPHVDVPHEGPLRAPVTLADGYNELGLWIPSYDDVNPFSGILLAWADDMYPTPTTVQYGYFTEGGHLVMCREVIPYIRIKDLDLDTVITTFII